jgi:hypothetical protein
VAIAADGVADAGLAAEEEVVPQDEDGASDGRVAIDDAHAAAMNVSATATIAAPRAMAVSTPGCTAGP